MWSHPAHMRDIYGPVKAQGPTCGTCGPPFRTPQDTFKGSGGVGVSVPKEGPYALTVPDPDTRHFPNPEPLNKIIQSALVGLGTC